MAITIAVSGKGGSGKTTIASMLVRVLLERKERASILCVDADSNSCLGLALGVQPGVAVAEIREQGSSPEGSPPGGIGRVRRRGCGRARAGGRRVPREHLHPWEPGRPPGRILRQRPRHFRFAPE